MKKATKSENNLINICNHNIGSDAKVQALRRHVARAVKAALKKRPPEIVYTPSSYLA